MIKASRIFMWAVFLLNTFIVVVNIKGSTDQYHIGYKFDVSELSEEELDLLHNNFSVKFTYIDDMVEKYITQAHEYISQKKDSFLNRYLENGIRLVPYDVMQNSIFALHNEFEQK